MLMVEVMIKGNSDTKKIDSNVQVAYTNLHKAESERSQLVKVFDYNCLLSSIKIIPIYLLKSSFFSQFHSLQLLVCYHLDQTHS